MKIFIPFSEDLVEATGFGIGELVPFRLEYECLRLHGWESVEIVDAEAADERELQPA